MRFLRHLAKLLTALFGFAWENKAWWIVPMVLIMLVIALLIVTGSGVSQFLYPLI
jgi:hypothetical protein